MAATNKNLHLTEEERNIIANGIQNGSTKSSIANVIGKDKSTIGKEIKMHRILTHKCPLPLECFNYAKCKHGRNCTKSCVDYKQFICKRRDRTPGACNGCDNFIHCRYNKYVYKPSVAHNEYRESLVDSRLGVNLTTEEAKAMGLLIKPLLAQGQSPYQIILNHPELGITEKTLYTYIETGVFNIVGISSMDLRRQVSRTIPKAKKNLYKKREDKRYLKGRTFKDYQNYIEQNSNMKVIQMDTVYNDGSNGPFIQTFKFIETGFFFALYHEAKTAEVMASGVELLDNVIGQELFNKYVEILLTDRGTEFVLADAMEKREGGTVRTRVFYCDPMQSCQKGSLENKHIELRYILPKEVDLRKLGLKSQEDLNLVLSHLNSSPNEKLNGKSAIELTEFLYPELVKKFNDFGINKIDRDKVILKPYLLKK